MSLGPWGCFKAMLAEQLGIEVHGILGQCPSASGIEALKGTRKRLRKSEEDLQDLQDLHLDTIVQKEPKQKHGNRRFFIWTFAEDLICLTCLSRSSRVDAGFKKRSAEWVTMCLHWI